MLYFIQTTRFVPIDFKKYGFKVIDDNTILLEKDGSIWKSTKLYDLGWGRENGFYRTPMPKQEELFFMVFPNEIKNDFEERFNYWGSISIMLDEYCDFLLEKISNELIVNKKDFIDKYENALLYINSELNVSDNLNKIVTRLNTIDSIIIRLYEDLVEEKLSGSNYQKMLDKYQDEQKKLNSQLIEIESKLTQENKTEENIETFKQIARNYIDFDELTPEIINNLISHITVSHVKVINGTKFREIKIIYKFIG